MSQDFKLWLNGNSLVLASAALSDHQVKDLLNVQLCAYLDTKNNVSAPGDISDWYRHYHATQASLGCVSTVSDSHTASTLKNEPALDVFDTLHRNLSRQLARKWHPKVDTCLNAFVALEGRPAQQALWAECINAMGCSSGARITLECRVLLPDALIVSSELSFCSSEPVVHSAPRRCFENTYVRDVSTYSGTYMVQESVLREISPLLEERLEDLRDQYICPILLPGITHVGNRG
ncbi:hypothetical protein [Pseudomonas sp. PSKL.D1]|uniref:hypothetical protein n=1 Tax=Pseudomonas sp. PSKL.D1 TaxID=3029060 RepID=UPI0023815B16|nr:hypothetical protein [Pseudomonas sp. PSKL.D1]WDY57447.1 hypothetical protein PVV54_23200 [Pseudomonas sp. PSKL.D1]